MRSLAEWLEAENARLKAEKQRLKAKNPERRPRRDGALTNLWRISGVAWSTLNRAKNGARVTHEVATRIHQATRGEVPVSVLTYEEGATSPFEKPKTRVRATSLGDRASLRRKTNAA